MNITCPKCEAELEVENADGTPIRCPLCGQWIHSVVDPGSSSGKGFTFARSPKPAEPPELFRATHIYVTCHTQGVGEWTKPKGAQGCLLFFLGLVTLFLGIMIFGTVGELVGVTLMVVAVVVSVIPRDTTPVLRCASCGSVEMIPLGSPRAVSMLR